MSDIVVNIFSDIGRVFANLDLASVRDVGKQLSDVKVEIPEFDTHAPELYDQNDHFVDITSNLDSRLSQDANAYQWLRNNLNHSIEIKTPETSEFRIKDGAFEFEAPQISIPDAFQHVGPEIDVAHSLPTFKGISLQPLPSQELAPFSNKEFSFPLFELLDLNFNTATEFKAPSFEFSFQNIETMTPELGSGPVFDAPSIAYDFGGSLTAYSISLPEAPTFDFEFNLAQIEPEFTNPNEYEFPTIEFNRGSFEFQALDFEHKPISLGNFDFNDVVREYALSAPTFESNSIDIGHEAAFESQNIEFNQPDFVISPIELEESDQNFDSVVEFEPQQLPTAPRFDFEAPESIAGPNFDLPTPQIEAPAVNLQEFDQFQAPSLELGSLGGFEGPAIALGDVSEPFDGPSIGLAEFPTHVSDEIGLLESPSFNSQPIAFSETVSESFRPIDFAINDVPAVSVSLPDLASPVAPLTGPAQPFDVSAWSPPNEFRMDSAIDNTGMMASSAAEGLAMFGYRPLEVRPLYSISAQQELNAERHARLISANREALTDMVGGIARQAALQQGMSEAGASNFAQNSLRDLEPSINEMASRNSRSMPAANGLTPQMNQFETQLMYQGFDDSDAL